MNKLSLMLLSILFTSFNVLSSELKVCVDPSELDLALFDAIQRDHIEGVQLMLENGANPYASAPKPRVGAYITRLFKCKTILEIAFSKLGCKTCLKFLELDLNVANYSDSKINESLLANIIYRGGYDASNYKHLNEVISKLIKMRTTFRNDDSSYILNSLRMTSSTGNSWVKFEKNNFRIFKLLYMNGFKLDKNILHYIDYTNKWTVDFLNYLFTLNETININDTFLLYGRARLPITLAIQAKNWGAMDLLIKNGTRINARAVKSLAQRVARGESQSSRFWKLINLGGNINAFDGAPLWLALLEKNQSFTIELIQKGADVELLKYKIKTSYLNDGKSGKIKRKELSKRLDIYSQLAL